MTPAEPVPTLGLLARMEAVAVELAAIGGREILATLGSRLAVQYKGDDDAIALLRDPVSEVDSRVEAMIRRHLTNHFPDHGIIGEEMAVQPGLDSDFVWAVDPIDGTSNFINGFPLFASSVGVLYRGIPVAGALWCSTSHLLTPGIYHCGGGTGLRFEGEQVSPMPNPAVRKRLAGDPHGQSRAGPWDGRKTGSAAIECAFVAAGLLQVARFATPNIWDVAGGIALARASGSAVFQEDDREWTPFESFGEQLAQMAQWQRPLILGTSEDAAHMIDIQHADGRDCGHS
ncbi:myo-inositol-1(or 4)-monophosphatase [Sphingobium xenophagum]|uniref:Myo-inositol-1(Or 4)-monophosphatase n=1 Tax=Sphingobium xenophagum TaxID=121428 RepID=A0ABU1X600_SPHXE|nr:inositol monophosphatase [Sphingobium xenophagum]MDR7157011.1 myo-inositol-1(or 4)-monophosphatase [Sphingobium xenophagum]